MNTRTAFDFSLPIGRVAFAFVTSLALHADTAVSFRNGAGGYSGAKDFSINTQYAQYNGGNGIQWTGDPELGCYTTTGDGSYTVRYLLKFTGLSVPAGSKIVSATLTIALDSWNDGPGNITGFYLKNAWNPASSQLGWLHRDNALDWAAPGASATGVDTVAGLSFQVPPLRPVGAQNVTIPLNVAEVQSWIDSPSTNQGIILVNNNPGEIIRPVSVTGKQNMRPMLTIVIAGTSTGVQLTLSPTSATVPQGGQQPFTATVTGSSNTAVTWSATGGSISSAGVYTAGSAAGNFTVTAKSVADPTKTASANVTVQPVQISVSPSSVTLQPGQTKQFTATVTGSTNNGFTWTASGGSISTSGLFTAGSTAGAFSVTATAAADSTKSSSAQVTIQAAPPPITVTVNPSTFTLQTGQTKTFTATVTGTTNTAVTWTATGGSINTSGLFTAGLTAGTFSVTARSVADTTKSGSAQVIIQAAAPTVQVTVNPTSITLAPGGTQQFTAAVTGSSNTAVTWTATGGTITASGLYTGGQTTGSFTVTATSVADASKSATAAVGIISSQSLPPVPRQSDGAYMVVQSPVAGMHFTAPALIRIYGDPFDIDAPDPDALTVRFYMNGQQVGSYTGSGSANGYFPLTVNNVVAGTYAITAQITTTQGRIVTSAPVTIFVDNPPVSSGPIFSLTSDVVLSGSQNVVYTGTPGNHCAINGNGFQIRSAPGFTGSLTISNCDIRGLGTSTNPSINVTVNGSGSIQLTGNVFDTFGTVSIAANDQAQAVIRNNEFRENTLVPVTSLPIEYSNQTLPVFFATGNSTAQQYFQGNNVGLSTVAFDNTRNWLIGGSTDAESNVMIGVRCGFTVSNSTNMVLRGNYSQHNYPHRFSQGNNFQLDGDGFLVEHNIIRSSSWPVRGMGGELRYNLIDAAGNSDQIIQGPMSNVNIHHNVFIFTVSQTLYSPGSGLHLLYNVDNVQFHNNSMDGGGTFMLFDGPPISIESGAFLGSLRNNVFYNFATQTGPVSAGGSGESTNPPLARIRYSDYNDFYNPDAATQTNYGLGVVGTSPGAAGYGLHDLGGFNGHVNPRFKQPTAIPFPFLPEDIWSRSKKVSDVLSTYRMMYSPTVGSPLIGAGDPQDGVGGNIGAVGNGEPADQFGLFGGGSTNPPPPPAPVIASFTASPDTIQSGQSATLSWSVSGATSLSIAPQVGSVTGSSVAVSPSVTTTYTLTATNSSGSATKTTTVTVSAAPPPPPIISVTVSPNPASVAIGGTQQFTATVTGTSNTAVNWTATGGTISTSGLYTAGTTSGSFTVTATSAQDSTKSGTASVNVVQLSSSGAHPRIILDAPTLTTLRSRAQSRTAEWTALKSVCDSFIGGGTVNFPGGDGYPDPPNVGEGYQGSGYVDALMPLGLCYHTTKLSDPATASQYGSKGVAILMAMSDPGHQNVDGAPVWDRDDGYGIRNFGFAMGIGYDWFHDLMTTAQLSQLQTALNNWINGFENDPSDNFEYAHPQGNYYAGYYVSKCVAALAVQGDSPLGDTWWNAWYNNEHLGRVAPYYRVNLAGGGWTEGYAQYGILATRNQSLPALAVKTAKNIDLIQAGNPQVSYTYPLDNPRWLMQFTWPTRDLIDDRGELYSTGDPNVWPGTGRLDTYRFSAGLMTMLGDPMAPMMHKYAKDAKTALDILGVGDTTQWIDFLFWDPTAPDADYTTLPMSYLAPGMGGVTARSDWSPSATFMSFMAGPYINNPGAGHESFDKGSLALERNKNALVVNADAWLTHDPNGDPGWSLGFDDRYGNWSISHSIGNRTLFNTFQVRQLDAQGNLVAPYGQSAAQRSDGVRTQIERFEDAGSYVLAVGQFLEDMYYPFHNPDTGQPTICPGADSAVTSLSRQIVYLRPSQFVVYDRSTICDASLDQYLAFHFPANPVEVTAPAPGLHRFDVNPGQFAGSMTIVLPANAVTTTNTQLSSDTSTWNKIWRTEIRATDAKTATRRWLTVFDLAPSASQVASATGVTATGGSAAGVLLASPAANSVVISGTAQVGTAIAGAISYSVPAAATHHIITDLAPSAGYTITVTVSAGSHLVTVAPGGSSSASANGVLSFTVSAGGVVQP